MDMHIHREMCSDVHLNVVANALKQIGDQQGVKMLDSSGILEPVAFAWIDLNLVRFTSPHQRVDELGRVCKVHILVQDAVNNQQAVVPAKLG